MRSADQYESAEQLLAEATKAGSDSVQRIELQPVEGFQMLGFAIPSIMSKWKGRIREVAMDSACTPLLWQHNYSFNFRGYQW